MTIGHTKDWLTVHTGADEVREGIQAFVEKRPVDYAGLRRKKGSRTK
jgi:naphthoate synthase